ncbi:cell growth-regulating nucleolar protein [Sardina pilchardus]|uniref:cell growth-regulating nucleolar protein n=1 Tax=Sardina pilchardus TaxID=27697 RepID=UPI002E0FAC5E
MVFFTCNACGESLKKAQVDKHVMKCRSCEVLSCIDCGKDFWGDDYKDHNKCISEDQKYGGKGYEAKSNKGDVKQQQWIQRIHEAMDRPGVTPKLKEILNQVSSYDNVPRKKAKFQNWMKNSLKIYNNSLHEQVWEVFAAATSNGPEKQGNQEAPADKTNGTNKAEENGSAPQEASEEVAPLKEKKKNKRERKEENGSAPQEASEEVAPLKEKKKNKRERKEERQQQKKKQKKGSTNGQEEEEQQPSEEASEKKKKKKKRKMEEVEEDDATPNGHTAEDTGRKAKKSKKENLDDTQNSEVADDAEEEANEPNAKGKFNWKGTIKAVLRQSPEEGLAVKKLRKKVLAAYYSFSGNGNFRSEEEVFSLFNKKINGNPKFKIVKDKVRLMK